MNKISMTLLLTRSTAPSANSPHTIDLYNDSNEQIRSFSLGDLEAYGYKKRERTSSDLKLQNSPRALKKTTSVQAESQAYRRLSELNLISDPISYLKRNKATLALINAIDIAQKQSNFNEHEKLNPIEFTFAECDDTAIEGTHLPEIHPDRKTTITISAQDWKTYTDLARAHRIESKKESQADSLTTKRNIGIALASGLALAAIGLGIAVAVGAAPVLAVIGIIALAILAIGSLISANKTQNAAKALRIKADESPHISSTPQADVTASDSSSDTDNEPKHSDNDSELSDCDENSESGLDDDNDFTDCETQTSSRPAAFTAAQKTAKESAPAAGTKKSAPTDDPAQVIADDFTRAVKEVGTCLQSWGKEVEEAFAPPEQEEQKEAEQGNLHDWLDKPEKAEGDTNDSGASPT